MIRMTIATDEHGNLLGAIQQPSGKANGDMQAGMHFGPGAKLRDIEVPDNLAMDKVRDVAKFHEELHRHVLAAKH